VATGREGGREREGGKDRERRGRVPGNDRLDVTEGMAQVEFVGELFTRGQDDLRKGRREGGREGRKEGRREGGR
jgi:hypothetical protein